MASSLVTASKDATDVELVYKRLGFLPRALMHNAEHRRFGIVHQFLTMLSFDDIGADQTMFADDIIP